MDPLWPISPNQTLDSLKFTLKTFQLNQEAAAQAITTQKQKVRPMGGRTPGVFEYIVNTNTGFAGEQKYIFLGLGKVLETIVK